MKKISAFMTAIAMLTGFTACEDKKEENIHEEIIQETTEAPFLELTDSDFTDVNMNLTVTDDNPPFEVHSVNLNDLDFGERMSPCKAEGEWQKHMQSYSDDPETMKAITEDYRKIAEKPSEGEISNYAISDGCIFFNVNFDNLDGQHDSSIFRYDIDSGELKEICSHTGLDRMNFSNDLYYCSDTLVYSDYSRVSENEEGEYLHNICKIDTETGKESVIYSGAFDWVQASYENLILMKYHFDDDTEKSYTTAYRLDVKTGQAEELYNHNLNSGYPAEYDEGYAEYVLDENGRITGIITDNYRFDTELKGIINGIQATEDGITVKVRNTVSYADYTSYYYYNLNTRERYLIKADGLGDMSESFGNCKLLYSNSYGNYPSGIFLFVPEIGTAFRLASGYNVSSAVDGNRVSFLKQPKEYYDFDEGITKKDNSYDTVLYWFDVK